MNNYHTCSRLQDTLLLLWRVWPSYPLTKYGVQNCNIHVDDDHASVTKKNAIMTSSTTASPHLQAMLSKNGEGKQDSIFLPRIFLLSRCIFIICTPSLSCFDWRL